MSTEKTEPPNRRRRKRIVRRSAWLAPAAIILTVIAVFVRPFGGRDTSPLVAEQVTGEEVRLSSLLLIFAFVGLKFFFSLTETALVTLRRTRVKQLLEEKKRGAQSIDRLLQDPPKFLAAIQIGIEFASVFASVEAATQLVGPLERTAGSFFEMLRLPAHSTSLILVSVGVILVNLTIGEVVPKSLGIQNPERYALRTAPLMDWLTRILLAGPVWFITLISNLFVRRFGGHAHFASPIISEEELKVIVETSEEHGVLEEEETEIIKSVFEFTDTIAREVMTPRIDMEAVPETETVQAVVKLIGETGYSRIPVYQESIDHITGIVHAKDILAKVNGNGITGFALKDVVRPALSIPENKNVVELLREMKQKRTQVAIVRDEYGGTLGLVSLEDLVEELVGEITDEFDEEEPMVHTVTDDVFLVDGRMRLDDLNELLQTAMESEEFDTIGGYVFGLLGHQPDPGEETLADGLRYTVHQTDGRRIQKVRIERLPREADEEEMMESEEV